MQIACNSLVALIMFTTVKSKTQQMITKAKTMCHHQHDYEGKHSCMHF